MFTIIIAILLIAGIIGFIIFKNSLNNLPLIKESTKTENTNTTENIGTGITQEEALRLMKAWGVTGVGVSYSRNEKNTNGAFSVASGGAYFRYDPNSKILLVSGLVAERLGNYFSLTPDEWDALTRASIREKSTLAEGKLELIKEPILNLWKPEIVLLTKSFHDDKVNDRRFVSEVNWLLEWSTYWRNRRFPEIILEGRVDEEDKLKKEAVEINSWVAKNRQRPW